MEKITVFLADWQVLFREGIHFTLSGEEDFEVIGEAVTNEEALKSIEATPPRVAILNANDSEPSGVDVTRRIRHNQPSVAMILIMDKENEEQLFAAVKGGAHACLTKDIDPDELVNIVRKVAGGASPINEALLRPEVASRVIDEFEAFHSLSMQLGNLLASLSHNEAEILRHIADGNLIEEVVKALGISEEEVSRQLEIILYKLVANNHSREVIEVVQGKQPLMVPQAGEPGVEYITKAEFKAFQEGLSERFESFFQRVKFV